MCQNSVFSFASAFSIVSKHTYTYTNVRVITTKRTGCFGKNHKPSVIENLSSNDKIKEVVMYTPCSSDKLLELLIIQLVI